MKKEKILNEIKELLLNDFYTLKDVADELNNWNGCLDYLTVYDYEMLLEETVEEIIEILIEYVGYISIDNEKLDDLLTQYFEDEE